MLKFLKRICIFLLVFIALLAVWIQIGSIDQDSFDDKGLLSELKPVPDAENGFLDIAFLDDENYRFGDVSNSRIADYAKGNKWNIEKVDRLLAENQPLFNAVSKSNERPLFSVPEKTGLNKQFPHYENFTTTNRLLIIKARRHVQDFEYDKAIDAIEIALKFSQHVQSDAKDGLLPWMIGLYMRSADLSFLHELISNYDINDSQYLRIYKLIAYEKIDNKEFEKVIYGQFSRNAAFLHDLSVSSIKERYKYFNDTVSAFKIFGENISIKEKIF